MTSHYPQGRNREYRVKYDLVDKRGYHFLMRGAGSHGSADLLLARPGEVLWVQVGAESKRLGPAQRERFLDDAALLGAVPVLAVAPTRKPLVYAVVTPTGFAPWQPQAVTV